MRLTTGTRLGSYEINGQLGAGGMGEVWRATDTKLGRDVALKVLPADFAADPERLARFEREAKVLASLNHPNIATLFGLETADNTNAGNGTEITIFLVMELVDGEDLSETIARGPVSVDDAIPIASQIAEALEAAHEQGIVHRDLKPANIKLTDDGVIKVLDFGLAKAWDAETGDSGSSLSPTLTRHATVEGVILGTAAYMSPEQARGKKVDRRADIWAYGVVLWEMLTGHKLFEGETVSDVLAAVLRAEIDLGELPAGISPTVHRVLSRCLVRDPRMRLRDIGDARLELTALSDEEPTVSIGPVGGRIAGWKWPGIAAAVVLTLASAAVVLYVTRPSPPEPVRRFNLASGNFEVDRDRIPSVSPDGGKALWSSRDSLWVQGFSEFDATELPGTVGARFPFWSPDSRAVGFVRDDRVWRVDLDAGSPVSIGSVPPESMTGSGAGSWGVDGGILLAGSHMAGLYAISGRGGEAVVFEPLMEQDEADFHHVSRLPGSTAVVVSVHGVGGPNFTLQLISEGERKVLFGGPGHVVGAPVYSPTGHLLFERSDTNPGIWALPFSLDRLEVEGPAFIVIQGGQIPSLAEDGTLLYVREGVAAVRRMVWVDANGGVEQVLDESKPYGAVRLSPDGQRLVFQVGDGPGNDLWLHDLERSITAKLTHSGGINASPLWMPDGERIVFSSDRGGRGWDLYIMSADGSSEPTLVFDSDVYIWPSSVSSDGRFVVFSEFDIENRLDLYLFDFENGSAQAIADSEFAESAGALSPDDRWLAYVSEETGQREVYVRPLASATGRVQVSSGGGDLPVWSDAGDRLFFRQQDRMMVVSVAVEGPEITLGRQQEFAIGLGEPRTTFIAADVFDVTADGSRLIMSLSDPDNDAAPRLGVMFGFLDQLRSLAEDSKR